MILNAYSVYDRKALVYHPPFYAPTDGAAIRILTDTVNDPQTALQRHPADYILFQVGHYDDSNGVFTSSVPAVHVVDAQALVTQQAALPFDQRKE